MKTCIITFQIPKSDPLLHELNALFGRSNHVALMVANNEMDILKAIKAHGNALLIINIASKAHLQRSVGLFKTNAKLIKASLLRPVAILHTENKKIDRILTKYGCKDVMEPGLSGKTLKYKIDFWVKTLQRNMAKIEALKKQKMAASRQLQSEADTNTQQKDYIETKQLDLASDIWIIDEEKDIKKIFRRYLVKVKGPSPYAVRWVEMKRNPKDKFPTWKAIVEGDDADMLIMDEGAWFFVGAKPDFDWNANLWNFSSEEPHLFFYTQDKKVFSRFRLAKAGLYVARNSDAAKQKGEIIESTFEKDVKKLEKLQRMQEAERASEKEDFGHLDEAGGESDRMNPHEDGYDEPAELNENEQLPEMDMGDLLGGDVEPGEELNPNEQLPEMDMGDLLGEEVEPGAELNPNEQLPEMDMGDLLGEEVESGEAPMPAMNNLLDAQNVQEPSPNSDIETFNAAPMENLLSEELVQEESSRPRAEIDDDLYGQDSTVFPHGYEEFNESSVGQTEGGEYEGHYHDPSASSGSSPFDGAQQRAERNGMDLEGKFNNKADVLEDEVLSREKTEHINHEDLEGRADTDHLDHDPMSGRASTDHLEHDPMSGRASTDEIDGDPMSGRGYTDEIEAGPLSGRSYTDEIDGDPLSGRSYTDEYGEDPLEGRGETEEFEGHMEGRSETEELDHDPLSGPASNEEIEHEPLQGDLETEHIESDPLSGSTYDSEEESGPMEGAVGETDYIEADPLSGSSHDEEEYEYEDYEDADGQVHKRKKKKLASYEYDEEDASTSGNKKQIYDEMDFDPEAEADEEGKPKGKYDWDESLFEEENKKKDKEGAQYYRERDEKAQSRQSEIEAALGESGEEATVDFTTDSGTGESGSGSKLNINLDEFLDQDPGVNTESGKVMVIVNQTTKEGNELSIIAEFSDYFEDEITVNVPRDSLVNDAPVEIDLKMKYGKSKKRMKIKGEVLELENYDDEKDQLIVKAPNLNVEEMEKFMEMFAERQENIEDFMKKARGY